ncbi:pre-toxin TG domain-containing protein [Agathobacter sp.]
MDQPNFVSSVLDITIIKPIIEACIGENLITGEDLTDMERGLKAFGKTALIDFAGNKLLFKNADGIEIGAKTLSDDEAK